MPEYEEVEYTLEYSDHALERMEESEVTQGDVQLVLESCNPRICPEGYEFHVKTYEDRIRLRAIICAHYGKFDPVIFDIVQPVYVVTNKELTVIITAYRESGYSIGPNGVELKRVPDKLPSQEIKHYA